ncbi:MAG: ATP-binding cassette domain-containing protein [Vicinamibacterales bacterium]|nr:ATP-binding cassette domain-containing protein [Vicinamibacterales bacterium]
MLEIHELVKVYPGGVAALQGVSLSIPTGMFGLLGPNGSGKTTLMRIVAGLLAPASGRVVFDGEDTTRAPERLWPRLGYLPQDFGFYPNLTGAEMLRYLLDLKGVGAARDRGRLCDALLAQVNLSFAARRKVKTYSGGMRQRLGIAHALAGTPALLIVDEPTVGLDPEERLRFHMLLAQLAETRTVVLSTHIVEDVGTLCPRFAVIRHGRVVADTTPAQARARLQGRVHEGFVSHDELARLSASSQVIQVRLVEGRHHVRVLGDGGASRKAFALVSPSLEDAYLLMTREPPPDAPSECTARPGG